MDNHTSEAGLNGATKIWKPPAFWGDGLGRGSVIRAIASDLFWLLEEGWHARITRCQGVPLSDKQSFICRATCPPCVMRAVIPFFFSDSHPK